MNIFDVLNLRDEKYHNRMLAWLLDSEESHELKHEFLSRFLKAIDIDFTPETEDITVEAEYTISTLNNKLKRRPDIYLHSSEHEIFIENKVRMTSIDDYELEEQAAIIHDRYPSAVHIFIIPKKDRINASTSEIVKTNKIWTMSWSEIVDMVNNLLTDEEVPKDTRVILDQYLSYLREHIMQEFLGFQTDDIERYLELSHVLQEYNDLDGKVKKEIEAFLTIIGEEVKDTMGQSLRPEDWTVSVKRVDRSSINWGLYFSNENYTGIDFGVFLYYLPRKQKDRELYASVEIILRRTQAVDIFGVAVLEQFKQLQDAASTKQPFNLRWDEHKQDGYIELWEYTSGLQWEDLQNWPKLKDYLVTRVLYWMSEFVPVLEKCTMSSMVEVNE